MNPPSDPSNIPPSAPQIAAVTSPLPQDAGLGTLVDSLLKRPLQLIQALCDTKSSRFWLLFLVVTMLTFALYGLVIGSFSGSEQLWLSPLKVSLGGLFSILICFPSFYIFASLSGIEVSLRGLAGVFFSMFTLTGLLLLGFAPVAWVFSQSTESINFIGAMHLIFWAIATVFGLRLFHYMTMVQNIPDRIHLKIWAVIFVLVSLQMTTTLRPIIGSSPQLLPKEKKFFVAYWLENLSDGVRGSY